MIVTMRCLHQGRQNDLLLSCIYLDYGLTLENQEIGYQKGVRMSLQINLKSVPLG